MARHDLEERAKRCETHHRGCDCRELAYGKRLAALKNENTDMTAFINEVLTDWVPSPAVTRRRSNELIQKASEWHKTQKAKKQRIVSVS